MRSRAINEAEFERIFESAVGWFKTYILVAGETGLRVSEIVSLRWVDIDYESEKIRVIRKKNSNTSGAYLTKRLAKYLLGVKMKDSGKKWLFPGKGSGHISRATIHRKIKAVANELKIKGTFHGVVSSHSFRKYFAMNVYTRTGGDVVKTSKSLGHNGVRNLMYYLELANLSPVEMGLERPTPEVGGKRRRWLMRLKGKGQEQEQI